MLLILSYIIAAIGVIISLVGLPGVWVVLIAIVLSAFSVGFDILPIWLLFVYFIAALTASFIDNVAVLIGAKKFGASKWGMIGAVAGGVIGFLMGNFVGLILGPFFGAVLLEVVVAKKDTDSAIRAGIGTFLGYLFSILLKFIVAVIMASTWLYILHN